MASLLTHNSVTRPQWVKLIIVQLELGIPTSVREAVPHLILREMMLKIDFFTWNDNIFGPCSSYQTISEIRLVVNLANIQTWIGDCSKDSVDIVINIFYK